MRVSIILLVFHALHLAAGLGKELSPPPNPGQAPEGMTWIPGGTYNRGCDHKFDATRAEYPEERPVHSVTVDGFWMDITEVTNREFMAFTKATGYKTQAERGWDPKDFPAAPPDLSLIHISEPRDLSTARMPSTA